MSHQHSTHFPTSHKESYQKNPSVTIQLRNNCFKVSHSPQPIFQNWKKEKTFQELQSTGSRASAVHPTGCHALLPTSCELSSLSHSGPVLHCGSFSLAPLKTRWPERSLLSIYTYVYKKWLSNTKYNLYNFYIWTISELVWTFTAIVFQQCTCLW